MNMTIKSLVFSTLLLSIFACNQNPSNGNSQTKNNGNPSEIQDEKNTVKTNFEEGVIDVKISTPGSKMGELIQKVDPSKGDISGQMKKLAADLPAKDKAEMEAQSKKAGLFNLAIMMLPVHSTIYIKGDEATAKFEAITYHGENTLNNAKKEGMIFMKSQNSDKALTIKYDGDSFKDMAGTQLDANNYDIVQTDEISNVAGYPCKKAVYTLKNAATAKKSELGLPTGNVYKIEVFTSSQMPKAVNFLHPVYIKEDAGIMKLIIQYDKESDLKILYEFNKLESRAVTAAEMSIQKTKKISDYGKEKLAVGMEMMGIIFGM
ncbi:MAG: hypothetical protein ABIP95_04715 [Pelobium sp.]